MFKQGNFILASGKQSDWKIELDNFDEDDWNTLAYLINQRIVRFGRVLGVPTGGYALASALKQYATDDPSHPTLVVDDVFTTGGSIERFISSLNERNDPYLVWVVFARKPPPPNINALFTFCG